MRGSAAKATTAGGAERREGMGRQGVKGEASNKTRKGRNSDNGTESVNDGL